MDPVTLGLLMGIPSLIEGGVQTIKGISDTRNAKRIEAKAGNRPQYEIPKGIEDMLSLLQSQTGAGLPGEDLMKQDIQSLTSRNIGQASQLADSPVAALTALGGSQDREMAALRNLQERAAQYQSRANSNLARGYGQQAGYQQEEWRQNQLMPWEIAQNKANAYRFGGQQNIFGGMDTLASGVQGAAGSAAQLDMYQNMMPNYGSSNQQLAPYASSQQNTNPADTSSYNNQFNNALPTTANPNTYNWNNS